MTPPPHKKYRSTPPGSAPDATTPLQLSLFRLFSHLSLLSTHLIPVPASPLPILADLETLQASTQAFKDSLASSDEEDVQLLRVGKSKGGWKDEIDAKGTLLWNKSTAIKVAVVPGAEEEGWKKVVAMLRHLGFKLITIGSLEPPNLETHSALLSLANKTSLAFLSLSPPDFTTSDSLLFLAATHAEAISFPLPPTTPGAPTTEGTKVLLAHYCARVTASVRSGNMPVAKWMMGKAKELSDGGRLGGREVEKLAQMACDVGSGLVKPSKESGEAGKKEDQGARAAAAVEWLLWATQLLEVRDSGAAKALQVTTLKSLAQAYLDAVPARSGWANAESTLTELLVLEPSTTLWRRQIKLIVARKGGDGEVVAAFKDAASTMPWSEIEGSRLLGEMHRLPDERRLLRFVVIDALLDVALARLASSPSEPASAATESTEFGTGAHAFIAQILMTAVFLITDKDKQRLVDLLYKITLSQPSFELTSSVAFVCTTYVWRQGDKAHREKQFEAAAEWYLLSANSIMRAIEKTAWAKTFRKVALCYSEVGLYDRAEQVMDRSLGTDLAKSHFVRFYISTLKKDEARAVDDLRFLVTAPDFTLNMLFWAAKTAHESSLKNLLAAVLSSLLRVCRGDSIVAVDVDMMTLSRCLIRLLVSKLEENGANQNETATALLRHFETALELGTSLSNKPAISSTLSKNLAWLHKTGYNLCVRHPNNWDSTILVELYAVVASLMELDLKLAPTPDPETLSKLWLCRFAALSGRVMSARTFTSRRHKVEAYKALLPAVNTLRTSLAEARTQTPRIDRVELIESAVLALEVEALSETGDWQAIVHLVDSFDRSNQELPVEIIKAITERATSAHDCPSEAVGSILKRTLNVLHARKDLKIPSLSSWIRTIITVILARDDGDEALQYFKAALDVIKTRGAAAYPPDETQWLIATAWDQGLDRFSGHKIEKGRQFCDVALAIAKLSDPLLAEKLGGLLEGLEEQYPIERE